MLQLSSYLQLLDRLQKNKATESDAELLRTYNIQTNTTDGKNYGPLLPTFDKLFTSNYDESVENMISTVPNDMKGLYKMTLKSYITDELGSEISMVKNLFLN